MHDENKTRQPLEIAASFYELENNRISKETMSLHVCVACMNKIMNTSIWFSSVEYT